MKILHSTNAEEGKNGKKPIIFPFKKAKPGGMRWAPRATLRWPRRLAECTVLGGVQWRLAECTSFWDSIDLAHRLKIMPNNSNPINLASILPFLVKNLASIWLIWCSLAGIASGMLCTSVPSSIRGA